MRRQGQYDEEMLAGQRGRVRSIAVFIALDQIAYPVVAEVGIGGLIERSARSVAMQEERERPGRRIAPPIRRLADLKCER